MANLHRMLVAHVMMASLALVRYMLHRRNISLNHVVSLLPCSAHEVQQLVLSVPGLLLNQTELLCAGTTPSQVMNVFIISPDLLAACCSAIAGRDRVQGICDADVVSTAMSS